MKQLDAKSILAICMLEGEKIPCRWSCEDYFWRDFSEVKFLNNNYLFLYSRKHQANRDNYYFIFSIKENLLVDGFHQSKPLNEMFVDIKQFEEDPREYGR